MIFDLPKWWKLLAYDDLKSHVKVIEGLDFFAEERIKVGKEEDGTISFNQEYEEFQTNKDNYQTRHLLVMMRHKVHDWITQWQLIMITYTSIQIITSKVWTYYFVAVNIHPHYYLSYSDWIKKILPAVMTGEKKYFWDHEESYYDPMLSVWKNTTVKNE